LPDDRGPHLTGTQIPHLLDLQEVEEGIAFGGGYQFSFFPSRQLTRREPKNPK
jgi:hypothetical protein